MPDTRPPDPPIVQPAPSLPGCMRSVALALAAQHASRPGDLEPRLFVKDADGRYLFVDESFAADQRLRPNDMLGRTDFDIYPPELASRYRADDKSVMLSGQAASIEEPYTRVGTPRTVRTTKAPLLDDRGRVAGIIGILTDITDQLEARRTAERHEWMLAEGERLAHLGTWRYSFVDDRFQWSGEATRLFGITDDGAAGTLNGLFDHVHPDDRAAVRSAFWQSAETGMPWQCEHRLCLSDGRTRHVVTSGRVEYGPDGPATAIGAVQDVTDWRSTEWELRRVNWTLRAITSSHAAMIRSGDETELMRRVCEALTADGLFALAWIGVPLDDAERTVAVRAAGGAVAYLDGIAITWADNELGHGPTGIAVRTGKPAVVADTHGDLRFAPWMRRAKEAGLGSTIALPIRVGRATGAVMSVYATQRNAFGLQEIAMLERLADDVGFGIDAMRTRVAYQSAQAERVTQAQRHQRAMERTIEALSSTIESRDPYTAGHQRRVAEIATAIAAMMDLPADRIEGLRLAALVHDLGKIQIPIQILVKPDRLSTIEFDLIKTHSGAGYDILKALDLPWPLADIVHQHHEYLDGSGYPRGLTADAILLESRILTVADIVESMSSARPYRPALGIDAALAEIIRKRGTRLDPRVVDACLAVFRDPIAGAPAVSGEGAAI